jgi:hypothetical protein
VKGLDAVGREAQRVGDGRWERAQRPGAVVGVEAEAGRGAAVEPRREVAQGRVAAGAHVVEDRAHRRGHRVEVVVSAAREPLEGGLS